LRRSAAQLIVGDTIEVSGGVRKASLEHPITINLEKLRVLELAPKMLVHNPSCPNCGKRMKSMGSGKGFRCKKCKFRSAFLEKEKTEQNRNMDQGLHIAPARSQRHLTKPLIRYGMEKMERCKTMIQQWSWTRIETPFDF
jgi:tRNA(Ile2)-agmatinylcytidine synthase